MFKWIKSLLKHLPVESIKVEEVAPDDYAPTLADYNREYFSQPVATYNVKKTVTIPQHVYAPRKEDDADSLVTGAILGYAVSSLLSSGSSSSDSSSSESSSSDSSDSFSGGDGGEFSGGGASGDF